MAAANHSLSDNPRTFSRRPSAQASRRSDGPYALVLVPTREPFTWIVPGVLMGGEKRKSEKARLRKGINILISTPGRLVDHIKSTKNIHFSRLRWLVFDEADRILDLGFEKDITVILNAVNAECQKRQNVLLSATLTEGVTRLADISLHDPVSISVLDKSHDQLNSKDKVIREVCPPPAGDELDSFAIPESLEQHVTVVPSKLRLVCLAAFILQKCKFEKDQKMVIFFSSCELVEFHYSLFLQTLLSSSGAPASAQLPSASTRLKFLRLHGNMEQEDVAARGLDLPQVTWIVQVLQTAAAASEIPASLNYPNMGVHATLQSFIQAYATYPRELKHIFHVRSLHLGHVAKSFGLRDAPRNLSALTKKKRKAHLKRPDLHKKTQSKHSLTEILRSEYSSGIEPGVAKVKKQNAPGEPGSQPLWPSLQPTPCFGHGKTLKWRKTQKGLQQDSQTSQKV
ncbi:hypothetical protein H8958_013541 [Nasalis larvatus]